MLIKCCKLFHTFWIDIGYDMSLQKGSSTKIPKSFFQNLYKNFVLEFFSKNQLIGVKSVEECNFNLF